MIKLYVRLALIALTFSISHLAIAQTAAVTDPGHPRVNEVDQRLQNQQNRVTSGDAKDQLNAGQTARDNAVDTHVSNEMNRDEAKNGGTLTKPEQRRMNRQLNRNSRGIHRQRKNGTAPAATTTPAQ